MSTVVRWVKHWRAMRRFCRLFGNPTKEAF
jgi:hypothetical protein